MASCRFLLSLFGLNASGLDDPHGAAHIRYTLLELLRERLYGSRLTIGLRTIWIDSRTIRSFSWRPETVGETESSKND